jgi:hypothetical protein
MASSTATVLRTALPVQVSEPAPVETVRSAQVVPVSNELLSAMLQRMEAIERRLDMQDRVQPAAKSRNPRSKNSMKQKVRNRTRAVFD